MPTEQELIAELCVGRNTLREALKVLQAQGVVEIRHGFGMFVAPENLVALADSLTFRGQMSLRHKGHEANELVDVRQALEAGLVGSAIIAITDPNRRSLKTWCAPWRVLPRPVKSSSSRTKISISCSLNR